MIEMTQARAQLPRIIRFLGTSDSPGSCCAHCGCEGRWVHSFVVEGGVQRSAMSGCVKLFPISPIAAAHLDVEKRIADRAKKGWQPSSWDVRALDAIEAFYAGTMSEHEALNVVARERRSASLYRRARFGGRR